MRVGDLIAFKPKSFGDEDWSNPSIVLSGFINDDRDFGGHRDMIWIVWCDGSEYMVNERNDDIMYLTSSSQLKA
tara:strand:- start:714 stop:935 length:222 start_codon:yes stop_codon:yes gene_type:complete